MIYEFLAWLTYPPRLSLCVGAGALVLLALGWMRLAVTVGALAMGWSVLWSLPHASDWLNSTLARRTELVVEESLPRADAIVVLGGATNYGWLEREEVDADDLRYSRVAAGARAWLAGRAPVVVLSGGGGRNAPSEADLMAKAIIRLGVPESALVLEERSHSTRENAKFTSQLARGLGIRCILLVTSAVHMPRASLQFTATGLQVVEFPAPVPRSSDGWLDGWLPSRGALWRSGRALKEYGALVEAHLRLESVDPIEAVLGDGHGATGSGAFCRTPGRLAPPGLAKSHPARS